MPRKAPLKRLLSINKVNNEDVVRDTRQLIRDESVNSQQNAWDQRWKSGATPWNLGKATPALLSELKQYWDDKDLTRSIGLDVLKNDEATPQRVFRTLVPGCGAGYDLVALAHHHDQWLSPTQNRQNGNSRPRAALVVGLDISDTSLADHAAPCVEQALQASPVSWTRVDLVQGDFFKSSNHKDDEDGDRWSTLYSYGRQLDVSGGSSTDFTDAGKFDFIFDYTFFCALPPSLRAAWGATMASLLQPDTGRLLTIIFPIVPNSDKESSTAMEGPPFPVTVDEYRKVLEPHGVFIRYDYGGPRVSPATVAPRSGKELVCWWSHGSRE